MEPTHANGSIPKLVLALVVGLAGCGDDDAINDAGPLPVDQCLASADRMIVEGLEPDGGGAPGEFTGVLGVLEGCGRGPCLADVISGTDEEVIDCYNTCLDDGTEAADLSLMCRQCFYEAVFCAQEPCVVPCLGMDPVGCETCLQENCYPRMDDCVGF